MYSGTDLSINAELKNVSCSLQYISRQLYFGASPIVYFTRYGLIRLIEHNLYWLFLEMILMFQTMPSFFAYCEIIKLTKNSFLTIHSTCFQIR